MTARLLLCAVLLASCDSSSDDAAKETKETKAPPPKKAPEPTPEPTPEPPGPPSFADEVRAFEAGDPNAIRKAIDRFEDRFGKSETPVDESERFAALDFLIEYIATQVRDPYAKGGLLESGALGTAACMRTDRCDTGEPTLAAQETLAALESRGIKLLYAGKDKFDVVPDREVLAKHLGPALSDPAALYLHARLWQVQKVEDGYDEQGFIGNPNHVAEGVKRWEAVTASKDPLYAPKGTEQATKMAERYLRVCHRKDAKPACAVTRKQYLSYKRFLREQRGSIYRPSVEHFVAQAKEQKSRLDAAALDTLVRESLAKAQGTAASTPGAGAGAESGSGAKAGAKAESGSGAK